MFNIKTKDKEMFSDKFKIATLVSIAITLMKDVTKAKEDIEKLQEDRDSMLKEIGKRDQVFMDFLKVELTIDKAVVKGADGKDIIKSTYKLIKK